jgi:tetratricopeptide (TPR) repeat protein
MARRLSSDYIQAMALRTLFLPFLLGMTLCAGSAVARESDSFLALAKTAESKGDVQGAVRLAQAALVQEPARPDSYVLLGDLYAQQSEGDYARFYYEEALTIDPQNARARAGIGKLDSNPKTSANAGLDKK